MPDDPSTSGAYFALIPGSQIFYLFCFCSGEKQTIQLCLESESGCRPLNERGWQGFIHDVT